MTEHPALAALRAAHAALGASTVTGADGRPAGWVSLTGLTPFELAEAVRFQAGLEGRVAGLRLHTVAAADAGGAAEERVRAHPPRLGDGADQRGTARRQG